MTTERRSIARCPICDGPAIIDVSSTDGIRCRNSSCRQNHAKVECPRCYAKEMVHAIWSNKKWKYTCADCEHSWST